jgi:tetratricopeptide (TPR) repeat protein
VVAATDDVDAETRLRAWHGASEVARFVGDSEWAEALKREVVASSRATGDETFLAVTLTDLSHMASDRGSVAEARALATEALAIRRRIGEEWGIAHACCAAASGEFLAGNFVRAREIYEETIASFERASSRLELMNSWLMIGECLRREGDQTGSSRHLRQALDEAVTQGIPWHIRSFFRRLRRSPTPAVTREGPRDFWAHPTGCTTRRDYRSLKRKIASRPLAP